MILLLVVGTPILLGVAAIAFTSLREFGMFDLRPASAHATRR